MLTSPRYLSRITTWLVLIGLILGGELSGQQIAVPSAFGQAQGASRPLRNSRSRQRSRSHALTSGSGTQVSVDPPLVAFGNQSLGVVTCNRTVTISNSGSTSVTLTGASASAPFSLTGFTQPTTVAPGASTLVYVSYSPVSENTNTAALTLAFDTVPSVSIPLSGTGVQTHPELDAKIPLIDMGQNRTYKGFNGGLYEGGCNQAPPDQDAQAQARAKLVAPLNTAGNPDPLGNVVLLSVGLSNSSDIWCGTPGVPFGPGCTIPPTNNSFLQQAQGNPLVNQSSLVILNGALGGTPANAAWTTPSDVNYDRIRDNVLAYRGLTEQQVQAVWLYLADSMPTVFLPDNAADAYAYETNIGAVVRALHVRYPHLRVIYLTTREYAGYAVSNLNPEPYAYEYAYAMKWLIQAQVDQMRNGGSIVDQRAGDLNYNTVAPVLVWGPYTWATSVPNSQGMSYTASDFQDDGTHPSPSGIQKIASSLMDYFLTSPYSPWFPATPPSPPAATLSVTSLDFGSQNVGSTSLAQTLTLANSGGSPLQLSGLSLGGNAASDYAVSSGCGNSLPAASACSIGIYFKPTAAGTRLATLVISDSDSTGSQLVTLTGAGAASALTLAPSSIDFGQQMVGNSSAPQNAALTNAGQVPVNISSILTNGPFLQSDDCGLSLGPGASCTISVSFDPTTMGPSVGTVSVTDDSVGSPQTISTSGMGIMAAASVSPSAIAFGNQSEGTTSTPHPVTLTNAGYTVITITSIGADEGFHETDNCGGVVAVGGSCILSVTFSPGRLGSYAGNLQINDNSSSGPQLVALSGTGSSNAYNPVPHITDPLLPSGIAPGTQNLTLSVDGSGFVSGSVVFWNGAPRTTAYVSADRLTASLNAADLASATTSIVTVVNPAPGGGASNPAGFAITNATAALTFSRNDLTTAAGPSAMAARDLTADGIADLVVANRDGNSISVFAGVGTGTFLPPTTFPTGAAPVAFSVADLNADGLPDLAVANNGANSVSVLLGTGAGQFAAPVSYPVGNGPVAIDSADLNGDGSVDLIVANQTDGTVSVLTGNGDGTFAAPQSWTAGAAPSAIAAADYNNDGLPDVAVAVHGGGAILLLISDGNGGFLPANVIASGVSPSSLKAGDWNGDGAIDLAFADDSTNSLGIVLANLDGSYRSPVAYPVGSAPGTLIAGDFNGDGISDIAVGNQADSSVSLLLGSANGTFAPSSLWNVAGASALAAADFNRDGRLDLASAGPGAPQLSVLNQVAAAALSATTASFTDQKVGTNSSPQTIILTNTGSAALTFSGLTVSGAASTDYAAGSNCGSTILPGANCSITITFTPTVSGTRAAILSVATNSPGGPLTVALQGNGTAPAVTLSTSSLSYGVQLLNTTSPGQSVTLTNTGNAALSITSITASSEFLQSNTCGASLAAGASCNITVNFFPLGIDTRQGTVTIADDAPGSPKVISLSGLGTEVKISIPALSFGAQGIGSSTTKPVTITNVGSSAFSISSISLTGGNAADFSQSNTCGTVVAGGASCTISITFRPGGAGGRNANLLIADTGGASPQQVSLTGTGIVAPTVTLTPASFAFNTQLLGTSSGAAVATLTNTSSSGLNISGVTLGGPNATDFIQTNTCGNSLLPGAKCLVTVIFKPLSKGTRSATVSIQDNAVGSPQKLTLTGTGTAVQLLPNALNLGSRKVGQASLPKASVLTNLGTTTLNVSGITVTGANAADFTQTNTCGTSVAAGQSCTVTVTFKPTAKGTRSASVNVSDDGGGNAQTITLSGTGS